MAVMICAQTQRLGEGDSLLTSSLPAYCGWLICLFSQDLDIQCLGWCDRHSPHTDGRRAPRPQVPKSVLQARPLGSLSQHDLTQQMCLTSWTWAGLAAAGFSAAQHVSPLTELLGEVHDQQVK